MTKEGRKGVRREEKRKEGMRKRGRGEGREEAFHAQHDT